MAPLQKGMSNMGNIDINTKKILMSSQDIMDIAIRMRTLKRELEQTKQRGGLSGPSGMQVSQSIRRIIEEVGEEAAKMDSLGDALQVIANRYRETETAIVSAGNANTETLASAKNPSQSTDSKSGKDKRNLWQKFWDWVFQKKPTDRDTTTEEQEKAADKAMKKKMQKLLQQEKYSEAHWDRASVEERKQILQDYMDEVIKIYGLRDVKSKIRWESKQPFENGGVTMGYYRDSFHTVTLNEEVLRDNTGVDSYLLLGTVAHELRHAYQHEAVSHPTDYMVSQETLDTWKHNLDPKFYISYEKDPSGYYNQPVEKDARDFELM